MVANKKKSSVVADIRSNRLNVTFVGIITKRDLETLYTDVRFGVADLKPEFNVISDFLKCRLMYLNGLPTFRKIFNYILSNESGEIVRVLDPDRIIAKQIINATLLKKRYKPIYAANLEEAEEKLNDLTKREGLRFELHQQPVDIKYDDKSYNGSILNISTSGCAISSSSIEPKLGDELQLKFAFAGDGASDVFDFQASVVRRESDSFAVKFLLLDTRQKSLLWKCLVVESDGEVR